MNFTRECNYQACVPFKFESFYAHIKICTFFFQRYVHFSNILFKLKKPWATFHFVHFYGARYVQHKLLPRMVSYFLSRIWLAIADKSFEVKLVRRTEVTIIILCNEVCRFTWYSPGIHTRPFIFISASLSSSSLSTSSKKSAMCLLVK